MRAVTLEDFGGPERLGVGEVPPPGMMPHNEVRIVVHSAGVNPFDVKLRSGILRNRFPVAPGHVPGIDVAGVVVDKGFDVSHVDVGDRVYALLDPVRAGSYADEVVSPSWLVRRLPDRLSFDEAASIPTAGSTAWVALCEVAEVKKGTRVLVTGAAGGVGSFAVQLARWRGASVTAVASAAKHDYLASLGVGEIASYDELESGVLDRSADVIVDTKGGNADNLCMSALRRNGLLISIVRDDPRPRITTPEKRLHLLHFDARPNALELFRQLFNQHELRVPNITTFPLELARDAHAFIESRRGVGKVVLKVRE